MSDSSPPSTSPAPLALEEYAAVAARLLHDAGRPPADVLAELEIPLRVYRASAAAWERALDEELARGKEELLAAFATRFIATRAALGRMAREEPSAPPTLRSPPTLAASPPSLPPPNLPAIPSVPNIPIAPNTLAVDRARLEQPALPFWPPPPISPHEDSAHRIAPPSALPFRATAPPADPTPEPAPFLLVRAKPPTHRLGLIARLKAWLRRITDPT